MSGFDRRRRGGRKRDAQNIEYAKFEEEQKRLNQQRIRSNIDSNSSSGITGLKQTTPQVAASTNKSSTTETSSSSSSPPLSIDYLHSKKESDLNHSLSHNHNHNYKRRLSDIDDCVDRGNKKDDPSSRNKRKTISFVDENLSVSKNMRTSPSSLSASRRLEYVPDRTMDWNLEDDFHVSRKVTQDRTSSSSLSKKKNDSGKATVPTISETTAGLPSPIMKVGNNQSNSCDIDDADDDDDDFFQLMSIFQASKKKNNEDKSNVSTKKVAHSQSVPPPHANGIRSIKRGSSIGFSDDEDMEEKKDNDSSSSSSRKEIESHRDESIQNHNIMTHRRNHGDDDNDIDDDNDDDNNNSANKNSDSSCGGKKKSRSDVKKNRKNTRRNSSSDSSDDKESDSEDDKNKSPKRPRNPFTYAKEQDDLLSKMNHRQKATSYDNNNADDDDNDDDDDDGFMDDCKYIESQSPDKPKNKVSQSRKQRSSDYQNAASNDDDDDDEIVDDDIESPDKPKKKTSQSKKERSSDSSRNSGVKKSHTAEDDYPTSDGEEMLPRDADFRLEDLHPHFDDPKFGPYEMEPLLLTIDQTEEGQVLQVPASLNRYLIPFQKEGIKFLYECLSRKSGAILGDEMVRISSYYLPMFSCIYRKSISPQHNR